MDRETDGPNSTRRNPTRECEPTRRDPESRDVVRSSVHREQPAAVIAQRQRALRAEPGPRAGASGRNAPGPHQTSIGRASIHCDGVTYRLVRECKHGGGRIGGHCGSADSDVSRTICGDPGDAVVLRARCERDEGAECEELLHRRPPERMVTVMLLGRRVRWRSSLASGTSPSPLPTTMS